MKITKWSEFVNEEFQDPPEEYIKTALTKLKRKIESFFEDNDNERDNLEVDYAPQKEEDKVMTMSQALNKGNEKKKSEGKISFKDLNVHLESSEMSKYSAIYDSLTFKFSDEENFYSLYITIPLQEGMNKDNNSEEDFSDKNIENCVVKFKKYDIHNFDLIGQIGPKTVKIDKIDEEFLVDLKIELDDEFNQSEEEFEIET